MEYIYIESEVDFPFPKHTASEYVTISNLCNKNLIFCKLLCVTCNSMIL